MNDMILQVTNLKKQFNSSRGEFIAVNNLSFSIEEGQVFGLLGPNGAGKTTTIQMLLGVLTPTSGSITYFGKDFAKNQQEILRQINFASTYISLPWQFTVREILDIFARLYSVRNREVRIKKLLAAFDVERVENTHFFKLSAGEKTRIILAKAFLNYPKVVLLDEPTASLDPEIAIKVREFLKQEQKEYNVNMLLTSHNMIEVEEMCDRVMILNHGKVIAQDSPENLAKNISECEVELMIHNESISNALNFFEKTKIPFENTKHIFKIPMDEKRIGAFLMLLAEEKINYQEISIEKPGLEDYFLKVLGETI